jgi:hypothetical protein
VNGTGYKVLGFVVWRGARWYVRHTYGRYIPSRRLTAMGLVALAIGVLVVIERRTDT